MILVDRINYNKKINISLENKKYLIKFNYNLYVHNYDSESALISMDISWSADIISSGTCHLYEFDEFLIPHELTAKEWIDSLIINHKDFLKPENKVFSSSEDVNNKIIDFISKELKLKSF